LYTPCILDCALRFSNKILLLIKKKKKRIFSKEPSDESHSKMNLSASYSSRKMEHSYEG